MVVGWNVWCIVFFFGSELIELPSVRALISFAEVVQWIIVKRPTNKRQKERDIGFEVDTNREKGRENCKKNGERELQMDLFVSSWEREKERSLNWYKKKRTKERERERQNEKFKRTKEIHRKVQENERSSNEHKERERMREIHIDKEKEWEKSSKGQNREKDKSKRA